MNLYFAELEPPKKIPSGETFVRYITFKEFPEVHILATKKQTINKDIILVSIWRNGEKIKSVRYKKSNFNLYILDELLTWYYMEFLNVE